MSKELVMGPFAFVMMFVLAACGSDTAGGSLAAVQDEINRCEDQLANCDALPDVCEAQMTECMNAVEGLSDSDSDSACGSDDDSDSACGSDDDSDSACVSDDDSDSDSDSGDCGSGGAGGDGDDAGSGGIVVQ